MVINSSAALMLYAALLVVAYVSTIQYPTLPFLAFATQLTLGFVAYITKRLMGNKNDSKRP